MSTKRKLLLIIALGIVLIGTCITITVFRKSNLLPEETPDSYPLDFLVISLTKRGVSSQFITPKEHILPNCELQKWGGEQLSCDSGIVLISCPEYSGTFCREKNLLICGRAVTKDDILSETVDIEFDKVVFQCKDKAIDEYHLIRECYSNGELVYRCEGMSVPGII